MNRNYLYTKNEINFSHSVIVLVIISCLIAMLNSLNIHSGISICFAFSFLVIFYFMCKKIVRSKKESLLLVGVVFFTIFNVICNYLLSESTMAFDFQYLKKIAFFLSFAILLEYSQHYRISSCATSVLTILPVITGLILIFSYYFLGNNAVMMGVNQTVVGGITLGFSNSNFTGIWLVHFFIYSVLFVLDSKKNIKIRMLISPILFVYMYLIYLTKARACLIGIIAFILLLCGYRLLKKFNKSLSICVILFPVLFPLIYEKIISLASIKSIFGFLVSEGKTLSSRVGIWNMALEEIYRHPILGDYNKIEAGYFGFSHLHNMHLDVWLSYGVVVLILFLILLYKSVYSNNYNFNNFYQYACICGFYTIILIGTFEAMVVSGAMGLNLLTVGFLLLSRNSSPMEIVDKKYIR